MNILLIEDDEIDAEAVRRTLAQCHLAGENAPPGARMVHVDYYRKALEILQRGEEFDVILLDLHLPDGQGVPLINELGQKYRTAPVIAMTGLNASEELGIKLVRAGAQDYIPKSEINVASLTRTILYAIERHQLHWRIERQAQDLKDINDELEAINEELETFTYITSHDLRSPLVNLKGFSGELHRSLDVIISLLESITPNLPEQEREKLNQEIFLHMPKALSYVITAAEKMDRMTSAILKLSRLGRKEFKPEPVSTAKVVEQCLESMAFQIEKSNSEVVVGELPDIVGDRDGIEQVFSNLLDNALKYLDPLRPGKIRVSGHEGGGLVVFTVEDNGCGIAEEEQHKVFEIFRRAGDTEHIAGEGMGMPYVRAIIKRHGGTIWFDSKEGEGTSFHFTIAVQHQQRAAA